MPYIIEYMDSVIMDQAAVLSKTRLERGSKMIGVFHPLVPEELLYAAGVQPVRLFPLVMIRLRMQTPIRKPISALPGTGRLGSGDQGALPESGYGNTRLRGVIFHASHGSDGTWRVYFRNPRPICASLGFAGQEDFRPLHRGFYSYILQTM